MGHHFYGDAGKFDGVVALTRAFEASGYIYEWTCMYKRTCEMLIICLIVPDTGSEWWDILELYQLAVVK